MENGLTDSVSGLTNPNLIEGPANPSHDQQAPPVDKVSPNRPPNVHLKENSQIVSQGLLKGPISNSNQSSQEELGYEDNSLIVTNNEVLLAEYGDKSKPPSNQNPPPSLKWHYIKRIWLMIHAKLSNRI